MKNSKMVEMIVGVFVALGIAALFMLAMKVSNLSTLSIKGGFEVRASFENIGGLKVLSPVNVGGVQIGRVTDISYDQQTYMAVVTMVIDGKYNQLPKDTTASIFTAGLLGEQYISLEPGAEEEFLSNGSEITLTQSSLVMEQVIGQFLFSKASEGSGD